MTLCRVGLRLSKHLVSFTATRKKERPFDRLRANVSYIWFAALIPQRHRPDLSRAGALDLDRKAAQRPAGRGQGGQVGQLLDLVIGADAPRLVAFPDD